MLLFLRCTGQILVSAALICATASVFGETRLTLGHVNAASNPKALAAAKFAEIVRDKSKGKITIAVEGAAKLGDEIAMISALMRGTLDFTINSQGAVATVVPDLAALGLPYAFSSSEKAWELMDGSVGNELAEKLNTKDLVLLGWMDIGFRQITNNKRPITRPDELKGLRMRTTPDKSNIDFVSALGAIPVPMYYSNLYEALKIGLIEAQDNSLSNIYSANLHEFQKYISITSHSFGVAPFLISRKTWVKLSSDQRKLIKDSAIEATAYERKLMADSNSELIAKYTKMPSIQVVNADQAAFKAATRKVWDSWELKPFGDFVKKLRAAGS